MELLPEPSGLKQRNSRPMLEQDTAELLVQIYRQAHAMSFAGGLNPGQWIALRYFSRANKFSCTLSAFAAFQATTPGTASVVLKGLKDRGYLTATKSASDGRTALLSLTAKGRERLKQDPIRSLVHAIDRLDRKEKSVVHDGLDRLVTIICASRESQRFGTCRNCTKLEKRGSTARSKKNPNAGNFACLHHNTSIQGNELDLLCAYYRPA